MNYQEWERALTDRWAGFRLVLVLIGLVTVLFVIGFGVKRVWR